MDVKKEKALFNERVTNNICKIKVEFNVDDFQKVRDFAGLQEVEGLSALFQLCGMPPKCLYCKEFGHIRKGCEKSKLKCTKCNKTGHEAKECTFAKALLPEVVVNEDMDENGIVYENGDGGSNSVVNTVGSAENLSGSGDSSKPTGAAIFAKPASTTQTPAVAPKKGQKADGKKKNSAQKKKEADDRAFEKALTAIEKQYKTREEAKIALINMNETSRLACLQKFAPVATQ